MNASSDLERRLADHYANEAPQRAPDRVLITALASIDTNPQRHALSRLPWRLRTMNRFTGLAVAALAAIAVGAVGLAVLFGGRAPTAGTDPTPTRIAIPSAAVASSPPASARAPLSETFTSDVHGISVSYPAGWRVRAATEPWRDRFPVQVADETADMIHDPPNEAGLLLASQPLVDGNVERWVSAMSSELDPPTCDGVDESTTVDGRSGVIHIHCPDGDAFTALLAAGDRAYMIRLYGRGDMAWFRDILATVRLQPAKAVDPYDGSGFRHPFSAWLPIDDGWELGPVQGDASIEFRAGSSDGGQSAAVGLIIRAIDGGRRDVCAESSQSLPLQPDPETVIDYLESVPGVAISDERRTRVDGIRALQASIVWDPGHVLACPEPPRLFAQQAGVEETEVLGHAPSVRVTALDIDAQHVVMWTWAVSPDWYAVADELIGNIDFHSEP